MQCAAVESPECTAAFLCHLRPRVPVCPRAKREPLSPCFLVGKVAGTKPGGLGKGEVKQSLCSSKDTMVSAGSLPPSPSSVRGKQLPHASHDAETMSVCSLSMPSPHPITTMHCWHQWLTLSSFPQEMIEMPLIVAMFPCYQKEKPLEPLITSSSLIVP